MKKIFSEIKGWVQKFWEFLQRENLTYLVRVLLYLGVFVLILSIGVYFIEYSILETLSETEQDSTTWIRNPFDVIWWIIVTVTTVGYGDKFPQTIPGRFLAVFVIVYGTTVISVINSFIVNYISEKISKQNQGLVSYNFEKHIILCEWNSRSKMVIKRLRHYSKTKKVPIVLIADIDKKPTKDNNLFFVKGQVNEETLDKANVEKAKIVIILGDENLDYENRDVKVVSSHLTVRDIHPHAHTIVELVDEEKAYSYQELMKANQIIISNKFTSSVIAHSTIDHGIRAVISNLFLNQFYPRNNQLYSSNNQLDARNNQLDKIPVPRDQIDELFMDVFYNMKLEKEIIIVAIQQGEEGKIITNPSSDYKLNADDYLIVIAEHN